MLESQLRLCSTRWLGPDDQHFKGDCICPVAGSVSGNESKISGKRHMFQLNFSEQSMGELNKLDIFAQLRLVNRISHLTKEQLDNPAGEIGKFHRGSHVFYRFRADDFRIYFEKQGEILYCHYILPRHSLADFLFRFKLPVSDEQMVEQHESFWKYLESLQREKKRNRILKLEDKGGQ